MITIAGAGLAGLTAAIGLRRAGLPVRVYERGPDSGHARRPDWDAIENWTSEEGLPDFLARIGIDPQAFDLVPAPRFGVIDPRGRLYSVSTPAPFFYLVKRGQSPGSLEQGLKQQALDAGAEIRYGQACPVECCDIWAGGTRGSLFVAVGLTFRTSAPDCVYGLVDKRVAPLAYAYLVVVRGEGTLSVVLTRGKKRAAYYLERAIEGFRRHTGIDWRDAERTSGSGGDVSAVWRRDGRTTIGEAGGFQDFLWGFGIRNAIHSGYLAARAIVEGKPFDELAARELVPLVRVSLVNRMLYDVAGNTGYTYLIRRFARSHDLARSVRRHYRERPHHRLLWPLARWYAARRLQGVVA
jgi:flavin-dependent dehydrogenase